MDGYFLPKAPAEIFAAGDQARVPLLAGWNSEESSSRAVLGQGEPTPENYANAVKKLYPVLADQILKVYPGTTNDEVSQSATALAGDRFIAFSTWKWLDLHGRTLPAALRPIATSTPRPRPWRPRRRALRGDRVRYGQSGVEQGLRLDTGR